MPTRKRSRRRRKRLTRKMVVDFHSHVLPDMDDGATDVATAVAMLELAKQQGVHTVMATPHFYRGENSIRTFLGRRGRRYERLSPELTAALPEVRLGAEVLAWEGMSAEDLHPLCIEGTDLLLVEFPFAPMSYWLVEELEKVIVQQQLTLILAHLERYMPFYSTRDIQALCELPDVVVQLGAQSLLDMATFRRIAKWLPQPERLVLGSDMHNLTDRPPCLDKAMRMLSHSRTGRMWSRCVAWSTEQLLDEDRADDGLFLM